MVVSMSVSTSSLTVSSSHPLYQGERMLTRVGVLDLKTGLFSSFSQIPNHQIREALLDAVDEVPKKGWGKNTYRRDKAIKYLAAHYLAMEQNRNLELGGSLARMDERGDRPQFDSSEDPLDMTPYGKEYKRIIQRQAPIIGARVL